MFLKVIACEIAARELYYVAARSANTVDLEFLTQGHHDTPATGREEIQRRINEVPQGKYDAILLGYGLCSNILAGLQTSHTKLVVPRAHDCITFFMGSRERYQQYFTQRPGTYYYTSGWLECAKRRGNKGSVWGGASLPAVTALDLKATYDQWVKKYGEDEANYLVQEMGRWTEAYSHGTLIEFDFLKELELSQEVRKICVEKGWQYSEIRGDLGLLQKLLDGDWDESTFLIVRPGQRVVASRDDKIIDVES
jgi:hypothetical protein